MTDIRPRLACQYPAIHEDVSARQRIAVGPCQVICLPIRLFTLVGRVGAPGSASVNTRFGVTEFTLMLCGANCIANDLAKCNAPAFAAGYAVAFGRP